MFKHELDDLLHRGIITENEYKEFFDSMVENEKGEMIGILPCYGHARQKYDFDGDMLNGDLLEFVINHVDPPYNSECMDEVFSTYGIMVYGIGDYWKWFRKGNLTDYDISKGHKPIEDATEEELWKMIAIASRYWHIFYQRLYYHSGN